MAGDPRRDVWLGGLGAALILGVLFTLSLDPRAWPARFVDEARRVWQAHDLTLLAPVLQGLTALLGIAAIVMAWKRIAGWPLLGAALAVVGARFLVLGASIALDPPEWGTERMGLAAESVLMSATFPALFAAWAAARVRRRDPDHAASARAGATAGAALAICVVGRPMLLLAYYSPIQIWNALGYHALFAATSLALLGAIAYASGRLGARRTATLVEVLAWIAVGSSILWTPAAMAFGLSFRPAGANSAIFLLNFLARLPAEWGPLFVGMAGFEGVLTARRAAPGTLPCSPPAAGL
jgi:hypothetical protein